MTKQAKAAKKLSIKNAAAITALTAGLFAGSMGIASAATGSSSSTAASVTHAFHDAKGGPGAPDGRGGHGQFTVTAVGNGTITVTDPMGTSVTVTTTSSTTYAKDGVATTAAALAVGEHVDIRPVFSSSGTPPTPGSPLTAAAINIESPRLGGKVVSVDSTTGTIVVADEQGFYRTISTSSATTYTANGTSATAASVTVGQHVEATGAIDANHTTLDATAVNVGKPALPSGGAPLGAAPQGVPSGTGGFN